MTPRQAKLLKAIIDEFLDTAEAVGSVSLSNKYRLGVSPATIRNEMSDLVDMGYLDKPHSSSGRVPTNLAFRYFIDRLLDDGEELDVGLSSMMREELFQSRFNTDKLIYQAVNELAHESKEVGVALLPSRAYFAGLSNLTRHPEYSNLAELGKFLAILEDYFSLAKIFERARTNNQVRILIGEDIGLKPFYRTAVIYSPIRMHGGAEGFIGVIGPNRMNYPHNIALVDFIASSLNDVIGGW